MPLRRVGPDGGGRSAAFHAACVGAGYSALDDLNSRGCTGVGEFARNKVDGVRMSTTLTYLAAAVSRTSTIRPGGQVDRVVVQHGHAVAIEVVDEGRRERIDGGRITLAAGAVGSPAILLRSGIGSADALRALGVDVVADRPGVGAVLLDHPSAGLPALPADGVPHDPAVITEIGLRYTTPTSSDTNDMQLCFDVARPRTDARLHARPDAHADGRRGADAPGERRLAHHREHGPVHHRVWLNYLDDPTDTAHARRMAARSRSSAESGDGALRRLAPAGRRRDRRR